MTSPTWDLSQGEAPRPDNITDAMMIAMCVPNIIVLYILAPEILKDLKAYCLKHNVGKLIFREAETVPAVSETVETVKEEE